MKNLFIAAMLLVSLLSNATNCLTLGSDSIRINPNKLGGYTQHVVSMYNDAYCDAWTMAVTYPEGTMVKLVAGVTPLDGMTIPYVDRFGADQLCECPLNVSAAYATIGSNITTMGYWDYDFDNYWDSYGTVKWSAGAHTMFEMNLSLDPSFRAGYIIFDGRITSGSDQRGAILQDVRFYQRCWLWVGYRPGDVTGNDKLTIEDVSTLINYLLSHDGLDEFEAAAADVNRDGEVNIQDVTVLINKLLKRK